MNLKDKIRVIDNFPKDGISFKDITTLIGDGEGLRESVNLIADHLKDKTYSRREVKLLLCENSVQSVKKLLGINGECLETLFDILKNNECFSLNTLAINGNDLIKLGIENSNIGRILHELLLYVIDNSSMNEHNILIKKAIDLSKNVIL